MVRVPSSAPVVGRKRRSTMLISAVVGLALVASGCGSGGSDGGQTSTSGAAQGPFPVTVQGARGPVTVDAKPQRILALDPRQMSFLSELGEQPFAVGTGGFSGVQEFRDFFPWVPESITQNYTTQPFTADGRASVEAIAAMNPDLVLTHIWAADEQLYPQLTRVAPTYPGQDPVTWTPWREDLAAVAKLTGHDQSKVDEITKTFEADLAAAKQKLAGLEGKTFQVAALASAGVLQLTDYANEILLGLGMKPGEGQPASGTDGLTAPELSMENLNQLNADVVFIVAEKGLRGDGAFKAALQGDPRTQSLPAARNGTLVYLTPQQWSAINGGVPDSFRWWLQEVLPQLESSPLNAK